MIFRSVTSDNLVKFLNSNPSSRSLENVLEKDLMFVLSEYYIKSTRLLITEEEEEASSSMLIKPLLRVRINNYGNLYLETTELEAKLKELVAVHG